MLRLPHDEFVTIELVHDPTGGDDTVGTGLSHFVIQVESMEATITELVGSWHRRRRAHRHRTAPTTSAPTWIVDPDGNRIELVQWPAGHADGMTAADLTE